MKSFKIVVEFQASCTYDAEKFRAALVQLSRHMKDYIGEEVHIDMDEAWRDSNTKTLDGEDLSSFERPINH